MGSTDERRRYSVTFSLIGWAHTRNGVWKPYAYFMGYNEHANVSKVKASQWRHNGRDGVSNHQPRHCLLNLLYTRRSKKTSKLRVTGLCAGNSPVTGEFPTQIASNAENVSILWRHHVLRAGEGSHSHSGRSLGRDAGADDVTVSGVSQLSIVTSIPLHDDRAVPSLQKHQRSERYPRIWCNVTSLVVLYESIHVYGSVSW